MSLLKEIENRFKTVSGYGDLSRFPLESSGGYVTDRDKSREFAEVFTPPHIVDKMLLTIPGGLGPDTKNLDICAGQGQFTIRMLRKFYQENKSFDIIKYLKGNHFFNELQLESCCKLLWVFSGHINLAIGSALKMGKLPRKWKGVWLYLEGLDGWVNVTGLVRAIRDSLGQTDSWVRSRSYSLFSYDKDIEKEFVKIFGAMVSRLNAICKEPKMVVKKLAATKAGRKVLMRLAQEAATGIEVNWQNVDTPEWVVREMVDTVPDIQSLKKILVLFNLEFLEYLIKGKGIHPSHIDFGSDSPIEEQLARTIYKTKNTFSVGKSLSEMKEALNNKAGRYDVVFSNPPYQVQSETQRSMKGNGSTHASAIYHEIVMYVIDILQPKYVSMITPSRWMAGGRGLDDYRKRMLADRHIRMIQDFPVATGSEAVFNQANLPGGVSYFLWDRNYSNGCMFNGIMRNIGEFDVLVRDNTAHQILKKILAKHTGAFCNSRVLPTIPFGLTTNFNKWVDKTEPCSTSCYTRKRSISFVRENDFTDYHGVRSLWKIYGARGTGYNGEVFSKERDNIGYRNVFLGEKGSICTQTYLVLASFRKKEDAVRYLHYTQTKFFQFMLSLRVISQMISSDRFAWVPDMGDYSRSYTDQELYQHFSLTRQEIEHIERTIK